MCKKTRNLDPQGEDSVEYFLGLTPSGIILLRNKSKVGNYYWPRINKIYYKVGKHHFSKHYSLMCFTYQNCYYN